MYLGKGHVHIKSNIILLIYYLASGHLPGTCIQQFTTTKKFDSINHQTSVWKGKRKDKMKSYILASLLAAVGTVSAVPMPAPAPPGIPSTANAKTQLAALTVKTITDPGGYSRDLFPHWNTVSGACNTRYAYPACLLPTTRIKS